MLLASTALAIVATPAWADATPDCNAEAGPDGVIGTIDDGLECGVDADATGTSATAVGSNASAPVDRATAIGSS